MSEYITTAENIARVLFYLGNCVRYAESMQEQPTCKTCRNINDCEYRPEQGAPTRINCPFWEGGDNEDE